MQADLDRERTALRVSLAAAAGLAVLAVGWGWVAGSQVILLDGVYALIGMLLTWLSLRASAVAASTPTSRFPYGLDALVPLAIALQGFALFGTLAYAAVEAVRVIIAGGGGVAAGSLLAYGAVSAVACLAVWRFLSRADAHSDLLQAEAHEWSAARADLAGLHPPGADDRGTGLERLEPRGGPATGGNAGLLRAVPGS